MSYSHLRVLCKHIEEFSGEHSSVIWHIPHEASKDMIKKSKVVSYFTRSMYILYINMTNFTLTHYIHQLTHSLTH